MTILEQYFPGILVEYPTDKIFREKLVNAATGASIEGNVLTPQKGVTIGEVYQATDGEYYELEMQIWNAVNSAGTTVTLPVKTAVWRNEPVDDFYAIVEDGKATVYQNTQLVCGQFTHLNAPESPETVSERVEYTETDKLSAGIFWSDTEHFLNVNYKVIKVGGKEYINKSDYTVIEDSVEQSGVLLHQNGQFYDVYTARIVTSGNTTYEDGINYIARNLPYEPHGEIFQIDGKDYTYYYVHYRDENGTEQWVNTGEYGYLTANIEYGKDDGDNPDIDNPEFDRYTIKKIGSSYYGITFRSSDFINTDAFDAYFNSGTSVNLDMCILTQLTPYLSEVLEYVDVQHKEQGYFYYVEFHDITMRCDEYEPYTEEPGEGGGGVVVPDNPWGGGDDPDPDDPNLPDIPDNPSGVTEKPLGQYELWFDDRDQNYYIIKWIYRVYNNGAVDRTDTYAVQAGPLEYILSDDYREEYDWLRPRKYRLYYYVEWAAPDNSFHVKHKTPFYEEYEYDDDISVDPTREHLFHIDVIGTDVDVTVHLDRVDLRYAIGKGEWKNVTSDETILLINGQHVYFIGKNVSLNATKFIVHGETNLAGNISSLLNETGEDMVSEAEAPFDGLFSNCGGIYDISRLNLNVGGDYAYKNTFAGCVNITSTPTLSETLYAGEYYSTFSGCLNLIHATLPHTDYIPDYCFYQTFNRCSNLVYVPQITADTIDNYGCAYMFARSGVKAYTTTEFNANNFGEGACMGMFSYCYNLTDIPNISAISTDKLSFASMFAYCSKLNKNITIETELHSNTCNKMFAYCTSLKKAQTIVTEALAQECYMYMYRGCTSLYDAGQLPILQLAPSCYQGMFQECTALDTAPRLAAKEYAAHAYRQMFYGCSNLSYIDCNLLFSGDEIGRSWVTNVASQGVFYKNREQDNIYYSDHCVPKNWEVFDNNYSMRLDEKKELGPVVLEKNGDYYRLVQYYYNNVYMNGRLETSDKTDEFEIVADELVPYLKEQTEVVDNYTVRYYYVSYDGVEYKTDEYEKFWVETSTDTVIRQEGEFPHYRYYYDDVLLKKYYYIYKGKKTYDDSKTTQEVVNSTDFTDISGLWDPNWYEYRIVDDVLYIQFDYNLNHSLDYHKYVSFPYYVEYSTNKYVEVLGDEIAHQQFLYHNDDVKQLYYFSYDHRKFYCDRDKETTVSYIDITDAREYWQNGLNVEVDGVVYERWQCTVDPRIYKYSEVVWIAETTTEQIVEQLLTDIDYEQFILKTTTTTKKYYINTFGHRVDAEPVTETTTLDITNLEEYWTRSGYVLKYDSGTHQDIYYVEYTCNVDNTKKMHYRADIGWSEEKEYAVTKTVTTLGNKYELTITTVKEYHTKGKWGETVADDGSHPTTREDEVIDISDLDNEHYWKKEIIGDYKYYTCKYDDRYTEQFKIINVYFYGLDNEILASYEDIDYGTHLKVPEVVAPEHYTFTGWEPSLIVDADGYTGAITKSAKFYAQFDAEVYTITYCSLNADGTYHIDKTYKLTYGQAVLEYSLPKSEQYGNFLGWTPEYNPICTGSVNYRPRYSGAIPKYNVKIYGWDEILHLSKNFEYGTTFYEILKDYQYDDLNEEITFKGWYYMEGEEKHFVNASDILEKSVVLYPDFNNGICTVTFHGFDNALIKREEVKASFNVEVPEIPYIEGYKANGWDKEIENPVYHNADYYAQYIDDVYHITFIDLDGNVIGEQYPHNLSEIVYPSVGVSASGDEFDGEWKHIEKAEKEYVYYAIPAHYINMTYFYTKDSTKRDIVIPARQNMNDLPAYLYKELQKTEIYGNELSQQSAKSSYPVVGSIDFRNQNTIKYIEIGGHSKTQAYMYWPNTPATFTLDDYTNIPELDTLWVNLQETYPTGVTQIYIDDRIVTNKLTVSVNDYHNAEYKEISYDSRYQKEIEITEGYNVPVVDRNPTAVFETIYTLDNLGQQNYPLNKNNTTFAVENVTTSSEKLLLNGDSKFTISTDKMIKKMTIIISTFLTADYNVTDGYVQRSYLEDKGYYINYVFEGAFKEFELVGISRSNLQKEKWIKSVTIEYYGESEIIPDIEPEGVNVTPDNYFNPDGIFTSDLELSYSYDYVKFRNNHEQLVFKAPVGYKIDYIIIHDPRLLNYKYNEYWVPDCEQGESVDFDRSTGDIMLFIYGKAYNELSLISTLNGISIRFDTYECVVSPID